MSVFALKSCTNCSYSENHPRSKVCIKCGVSFKRRGRPRTILFHESIELPEDWDNSEVSLNVDDDLLSVCSRRIAQQRTYDKTLGGAVCYGCGHMLWSCVDPSL